MTFSSTLRTRQSGLTLVELMISMTIGLVLIGGTLFVYTSARGAYTTNESYALMQENARFALSVIEPDLQLSGYWGRHRDASVIVGSARERASVLGGITDDCGPNWVVQFDEYIEGFNDVTAWNEWACVDGADIQPNSDVFAIRRVSERPVDALVDGQIYMRSSEAPLSEVFIGNNEPTSLPDSADNYAVIANAYYVSPLSLSIAVGPNDEAVPALRRIQLVSQAGVPTMLDTEITTGIEDMQIQYGIGPANVRGTRGAAQVYVSDISNLTPPNTTVRSMRIWLLMRAERLETGYIDDKTYQLGDKNIAAENDGFRRLVVSKTVFFRNQH